MTPVRMIDAALTAARWTAGVIAIATAFPGWAQEYASLADGRAVFERLGCTGCHSYVSRRSAPSIRDLMREFEGDPVAAAEATRGSEAHRADDRFPALVEADLRGIAQWLGGIGWPEAETATATAVLPRESLAPPVETPAPTNRALAPARVAVKAVRLEKGRKHSDRLVIDLSGGEPDMIDLQMVDDRLVVQFEGARLGERIAAEQTNWPGSQVLASVRAADLGGRVELTISAKVETWAYTGRQGRQRLAIDLTAAPRQPAAPAAAARAKPKAAVAAASAAAVKTAPPAAKPAPKLAAAAKPPAPPQKPAPASTRAAKAAAAPASPSPAPIAQAAAVAAAGAAGTAAAVAPAKTPPAPASPAPAAKPEPPVQLALAKPESTSPSATRPAASRKKLKYRDGSDLEPCPPAKAEEQVIGAFDPDAVKEILDRIGCPQCHAYVQKKTGPPFRDVIRKYKGDPACVIHRLKNNPTHKEEGVTADIAATEFKQIADYVATRIK